MVVQAVVPWAEITVVSRSAVAVTLAAVLREPVVTSEGMVLGGLNTAVVIGFATLTLLRGRSSVIAYLRTMEIAKEMKIAPLGRSVQTASVSRISASVT